MEIKPTTRSAMNYESLSSRLLFMVYALYIIQVLGDAPKNTALFHSLLNISSLIAKDYHSVNEMRFPTHTVEFYEKKFFQKLTGDYPVYVVSHKLAPPIGYGNNFGKYMNSICCAYSAGLHSIAINMNAQDYPSSSAAYTAYESALPPIILHPNPNTDYEGTAKSMRVCNAHEGPWERHLPGGMYDRIELVGEIVNTAVEAYLSSEYGREPERQSIPDKNFSSISLPLLSHKHRKKESHNISTSTTSDISYSHSNKISENTSMNISQSSTLNSSLSPSLSLPLLPEVVVVFRCVDIVKWNGDYGFLNFNVYRHVIPSDARAIFINTEPLSYNPMKHTDAKARVDICVKLITRLSSFLSEHFPHASVSILRGNPHLSMCQINRASVVVSAPTTFTLFPAMANTRGHVYMGLTGLFADRKCVPLTEGFFWVTAPPVIRMSDLTRNLNRPRIVEDFITMLMRPETVSVCGKNGTRHYS
mmetsp:Transcript_11377/g.11404  ORF Transcript_11377/g.11404 Transcript_11377/m.11404 type:complete len:475 (+) Transcript_11377:71-1495(+)